MKKYLFTGILFLFGFLFLTSGVTAAQNVSRVRFARGAESAVVRGTIKGYKYIDYIIGIRANQLLTLVLNDETKADLVLFDPNGENVENAAGVREFSERVGRTGNYKVRILMPRAFARRNESTAFTLKIKIVN